MARRRAFGAGTPKPFNLTSPASSERTMALTGHAILMMCCHQ